MVINLGLLCFSSALLLLLEEYKSIKTIPFGIVKSKKTKKVKKNPDKETPVSPLDKSLKLISKQKKAFTKVAKENKALLKKLADNPIKHTESFEDDDCMAYSPDWNPDRLPKPTKEFLGHKVKKVNKSSRLMKEMSELTPKLKVFQDMVDSVNITLDVGPDGDLTLERYKEIILAAKILKKEGTLTNEMIRKASPRGKATSNADLAAGFILLACEDAAKEFEKTVKRVKVDSRNRITLGKDIVGDTPGFFLKESWQDGTLILCRLPNKLQKQEDSQSWNEVENYPNE